MRKHLLFFLAAYKGNEWYYTLLTHKRKATPHILWAIERIAAAGELPSWVAELKAQVIRDAK